MQQRWPHPLTQNTSSLSVPSRPWELGAWPFLAIPGKDMGALNWASMFHRAWSTQVLLSLGRAGRAHVDLIYPRTVALGRGLSHYVREPPGQEYWGLGQGSLGSCWLPAVPHQPCFCLLQVLHSWNGAQREKLGHHYGRWDSLKPTKTLLTLYLHGRRWP